MSEELIISKEELISSIISLVQNQDRDLIIAKLLDRFDITDLKEILHTFIDPMYQIKEDIFVTTKRFTKEGILDRNMREKQAIAQKERLDKLAKQEEESVQS